MRLTIWGCRGSRRAGRRTPSATAATPRASRSCSPTARCSILDAGTGIRPLGLELARGSRRIHICSRTCTSTTSRASGSSRRSGAETELHIWGPPSPVPSLEERIARYFSPPLFPVDLPTFPPVTATTSRDEPCQLGGA